MLEFLTANWLQIAPFATLFAIGVPVLLLAWWRKVYPTQLLVWLVVVPSVASLAIAAWPSWAWFVLAMDLAIVCAAAADVFLLPRKASFSVERHCGRVASLKQPHRVSLTLVNGSPLTRRVQLRDGYTADFDARPVEFTVRIAGKSRVTMHYDLKAKRRGAFQFQYAYLRARSRLGLWQAMFKYRLPTTIHVYPDMKQLSEYALLARTNRLSLMGLRRTRRIGQDNEFERLRDYTQDDNFKHIDWRATARRNKLTVKDFQSNQSQRIIFLVDCGRMMSNTASGLSLLDHSLNAMLMLSYVALHKGDSVGMIAFADGVRTFIPPKGGMSQMNQLLHASFDRFPQMVESRYDEAFLHLSAHCRKRSLVILVTNVIDEVNALQIERYLAANAGKHLPLGVLLRDHRLFEAADEPNPKGSARYQAAAAAQILSWRHQVLRDLEMRGVMSLDVFPEDMTAPLVNRYLEIKARHLL